MPNKINKILSCPFVHIESFERLPIPRFIGDSNTDLHPERKIRDYNSLKNFFRIIRGKPKVTVVKNKPVPKEVRKFFKNSDEKLFLYEGRVYNSDYPNINGKKYYKSSKDITDKIYDALKNPELKESISFLEGFVGITIPGYYLSRLSGVKDKIKTKYYDDLTLSFVDNKKDNLQFCRLRLSGGFYFLMPFVNKSSLNLDLAKIVYRRIEN